MKVASIVTIASALLAVAHGIPFEKRRFGNDGKPEVRDFESAVSALDSKSGNTGFFPNLSGCIPVAILGASGACAQQDVADTVIGAMTAFGIDQNTIDQITKMAVTYRQAERNSQDGTLTPECSRPSKSKALTGLKQAQDPNAKGTPPVCNSVYMDMNACAFAQVLEQQGKIEEALGAKFDDAAQDDGKGCKAINPDRAKLEGKGNSGKGDTGKGKGKGDAGKGGDNGDTGKGKGKGDTGKGGDNGGNNGCDNTAFTDAVGGIPPPLISQNANGKFQVAGNAAFDNIDNAHQRQCDVQKNQCFNKFNGGDRSFSTQDCEQQRTDCQAGNPVLAECAKGKGDTGKGKGDTGKGKGKGDTGKGKGKGDTGKGDTGKGKGKGKGDTGKGDNGECGKGKGKGDTGKGKVDTAKSGDNGCDNVAFTNPVGGVKPPLITENANGKFQVAGNAEFNSIDNAHQRQCDVQKNQCFNKFNGGDRSFSTQDCEQQRTNCQAGKPILAKCAQ